MTRRFMNYRSWAGAKWWRCDLHTHTPASLDYGSGPEKEQNIAITPREWLLLYMQAHIDCIAITDHNSGEWIAPIQETYRSLKHEGAPEFREICILPGVEVTAAGGIHILALFHAEEKAEIIHQLFGKIDYRDKIGDPGGRSPKSVNDVCDAIGELGGIAILAHVDTPKGYFYDYLHHSHLNDGPTFEMELKNPHIKAIELRYPSSPKPPLYYENKFSFPEILCSDSHKPYGDKEDRIPGSYYTWIKMGNAPSFEGFCLALLDGCDSIRRSDSGCTDPNTHTRNYIHSFTIKDATYIGRGSPLTLTFNPWLNTIIGGRGTGKSSIIEFLRLVFRREGELANLGEIYQTQKRYSLVSKSRDDDGLLTQNSHLSVQFQKDHYSYCLQWNAQGTVPPIQEITDDGRKIPAEGGITERFPVRICSQKQIFEMAKNPQSILNIIDNAPESGILLIKERLEYEATRYLSLQASLREIHAQIKDESKIRGELDDITKRIEEFETSGYAEILKKYQHGQRTLRELSIWEDSWKHSRELLLEVSEQILPSDFMDMGDSQPDFIQDIASITQQLESISLFVKRNAEEIDEIHRAWIQRKGTSTSLAEISEDEVKYHQLISTMETSGVAHPSEYGSLIQKKYYLEQSLQDISTRKITYASVQHDAVSCLNAHLILRKKLTQQRKEFAQILLGDNPVVRICITPFYDLKQVDTDFRKIIGVEPEKFNGDIGSIAENTGIFKDLYPSHTKSGDTAALEEQVLCGLERIKRDVRLAHEGIGPQTFRLSFQKRLQNVSPEQIDRLDCWYPDDGVDIEYRTTPQEAFRSIHKGSPGQMTAALLAIFLSYGNEPLILDQPEDDLDNQLIYTLIVSQLKEKKNNRQIIIVTHNPNIVVNGDAELVVSLQINGRGLTIPSCTDSLQSQKVRDDICTIMEGGNEALEKRYRRLTAGDHHV